CYRIVWSHSGAQGIVASELASSKEPPKAVAGADRRVTTGASDGVAEKVDITGFRKLASSVAAVVLALTGGLGAQVALADWELSDGASSVTIAEDGSVTVVGGSNINVEVDGANDAGSITISLDNNVDLTAGGSLAIGGTQVDSTGITTGDVSATNISANLVDADEVQAGSITASSLTTGNTIVDNSGLVITGGPSVTSSGINAGGQVISNVADGTHPDHAVNKGQLDVVSAAANAGWNVAGTSTANIGPNGTVTFSGDSNVTVTTGGAANAGTVNVTLNPDLNVTSVTADTVTAGDIEAENVDAETVNADEVNAAKVNADDIVATGNVGVAG